MDGTAYDLLKKRAPYYATIIFNWFRMFQTVIHNTYPKYVNSVIKTCQYLGIELNYDVLFKMNLPLFEVEAQMSGHWGLQEMKYDTYVNPPGKTFDAK
ncbi:MAG: hypothetical protein ACLR6I_07930 [Waltera sp.]